MALPSLNLKEMAKANIDIEQLRFILSSGFMSTERVKELRRKIEAIQSEMSDYLETVKYLEKLQDLKKKMSN